LRLENIFFSQNLKTIPALRSMRYTIEGQWGISWKICPTSHCTQTLFATPAVHAKWKMFSTVEQKYDPYLKFPVVPRHTNLCWQKCPCWQEFIEETRRRATWICHALDLQGAPADVAKFTAGLAFKDSVLDHFGYGDLLENGPPVAWFGCLCRLCDCGRCADMRGKYLPVEHSHLLYC